MKRFVTLFYFCTGLALLTSSAFATTYYSRFGSGFVYELSHWSTLPNGTGTNPPNFTSADTFIIQSGHLYQTSGTNWTISGAGAKLIIDPNATLSLTLTATVTLPECFVANTGQLGIQSNGVLIIENGNAGGFDLVVEGILSNQGVLTYNSGGTGVISSAGQYMHDADGGTIPSFTWAQYSKATINGIVNATSMVGLNQNFWELNWGSSSQVSEFQCNSQLTNVHILTVVTTNTGSLVLFDSTSNLDLSGFAHWAGTVNFTTTPGVHPTITFKGDSVFRQIGAGSLLCSGAGSTGTLRFDTGMTGVEIYGTIGAGVKYHLLSGAWVEMQTNIPVPTEFRIDDGATLDPTVNQFTLSGAGNFILNSGGTLRISNIDGITTSPTLSGGVQVTGSRIYNSGANYVYLNAASVTGNGLPATVGKFEAIGCALSLTNSLTVTDSFKVISATVDIGSDSLTLLGGVSSDVYGKINSAVNGTVSYLKPSGVQYIVGNLSQYGKLSFNNQQKGFDSSTILISNVFLPGTAKPVLDELSSVYFNGDNVQTIPPYAYGNLVIAGSRGSNDVTFSAVDTIFIAKELNPSAFFAGGTYITSGSTLCFIGINAQTISALPGGVPYHSIAVKKPSSTITANSSFTITGNLALLNGTLDDNGNVITLNGNIKGSAGQHITTVGGGKIYLTGGSAQHGISNVDLGTVELNDTYGAATTAAPGIKEMHLLNGTLDITNGLYILNAGTLNANGGNITNTGFVNFNGEGTVIGTHTFNNVSLSGAVNFDAGSTVEGVLQLNSGGSVYGNALDYANGSILRYNTGGTFNRDLEWSSTSGAGYPYAVEIKNNTTLDLGASSGQNISREVETDLSIESGSALTMNGAGNEMTAALIVRGSVTNSGSLELSGQPGGYLQLYGDLTQFGTLTANLSAVRMTGTAPQHITRTGGGNIALDSLVIASADSVVLMDTTTLSVNNGFVQESGIFNLGTSSLDITSGSTLTVNGGEFVNAGHTVNFTGGGLISGSLVLGTVTTSGALDPGSDLTITDQLIINNLGSIITNAPIYGSGSTLVYNYNSVFDRDIEWSATSGAGYPHHVTLQNNTYLRLGAGEMTTYREMAGDLTIASGSTLNMNDTESGMTAALGVLGDITNNGELRLSSDPGGDLSVGGDLSNSGDFIVYARKVTFNGAAAQSISGVLEFADMEVNNTVSNVTMNDSVLVNGMLTLQNGKIDTGTDTLTIGPSGDVTYFGNNYVIGNLRKTIPFGDPNVMFEIGDASRFSPAEILFSSVSNSGQVTASTSTSGPSLTGSLIDPNKNLDRYWTITNTGTDFSQSLATFHFENTEIDGGANTSNFDAKRWDGTQWNDETPTGWSSNYTDVNSLTSFGTFALGENISHNITATSYGGGSISPNGVTGVIEGNDQEYTITPDAGYYIDYVNVDGVNQGAIASHTFTNVTETHTIDAYFAVYTYSITVNSFGNGSISPGTGSVNYGSNNTYTITPDPGYHIDSVLADGINVGAVASHDFNSVTAAHTIDAYFSINSYSITVNTTGNGTVSPGSTTANYGSNNSFTIDPDPSYHVDSVLVDGVNIGAVLSVDLNSISSAHTIHAYFSIDTYSITVNSFGSGSISPGTGSVNYGSNNTYSISPDPGYHIDSVLADGVNVGAVASHDFNSVTAAHTIDAYFSIDTYSITVNTFGNGSITPGSGSVNYGSNNTYTISPDPGYHIDSVLADGINVGAVASHDFNSVTAAHTIDAYFSINSYSITVNSFGNGTVSPGSGSVNYGSNNSYTISPDPGYHIDSVLADGVNVGAVASHDFNTVAAAHTIDAYFSIDTYSITVNSFGNGSISPGTGSVNYGSNNTYTISPDPGYHIDSVLADGVNVGAVASHDFNSVTAAHTIDAYFSIDTYSITVNSFGNGSISPGTESVNYGSNNTYTISPDPGYHIDSVLADGVNVGAVSSYDFNSVSAAHTIDAYFSINSYSITVNSFGNGSISPGTGSVNYGSNNTYTISPDPAYHIDSVLADGVNVGAVISYDFNSVSAAHTIDAYFSIDTYSITVNSFGNGSISPGTGSVNYGSNNSYTITPDPGYHVDSVVVGGVKTDSLSSYTIINTTSPQTIDVYFSQNYSVTFRVDMRPAIQHGKFVPSTDSVILRGSIAPLNWTGSTFILTDGNNDSIYTLTAELYGIDSLQFKYVMIHRGLEMWERETPVNENRIVVLTGSETLPVESFDDLPVYTPLFGTYSKDANTNVLLHLDEDPSTGRTNYSPMGYALFDHSLKGNNGYRRSMNYGPGRFGPAISPGDSNFVVMIPDDAMLHSSDLTAEGWFNFTTNTGNKVLMAKTIGSGVNNSYIIHYNNGTLLAGIGTNTGMGPILSAAWTPVPGTWYHIAYTFDDNNDMHHLYVNGVDVAAGTNTGSIEYDTHPVLIGAEHQNEIISYYFDGTVDEIRLSSTVRVPYDFNLQLPPIEVAAAVTDSVVSLSWSNGGGSVPASHYRIYRGSDSTSMVLIDSSYTTGFSETLPNGPSIYYYRTATVDSTGFESVKSFAVSDTVFDNVYPAAPQNLIASAAESQAAIHWNPNSEGDFSKYIIYRGTSPNPTTAIDSTTDINDTLKVYTGLTNYQQYYFRIAAKDVNGNTGPFSNEVSAVPVDLTPPATPVSLNAAADDQYVDLTWTANSESDFAKYYIYGGTAPNPGTKIDSVSVIGNSFRTIAGLTNYTTYYYRITATDTSGNESGFSNEVSVIPVDLNPPSVPENMTAVAGNGSIELKWGSVPETDFLKYYIYKDVTPNPTTLVDSISVASDTMKVFSGLTNGTLYYMKVAAKDSNGNISMSDEKRSVPVVEAGNAMLFNGTDGYVQTPIISLTGDFTLEAWVKPGVPTDYRPIVSKNTINGFGNETAEFNLQVQNDGNLNFFMGNGSTYAIGLDGGILNPGQWYHVAVTVSGSTGTMYLNGVETANSSFSGSRIYNNLPLEIGKYNNGSIQFFDGELDEVRIWNVARTEAQIKNSMVKNLRGDTPNLVGLYHMDEPVSTTNTYDASPYNNTGSLVNGVSFVAGTGAMAPFAPQLVNATPADGQIQITWMQNGEPDFGKYYIYRGTSPNPTTVIDSTMAVNDTSKTMTGLTNYTDYYFRVAAADQNGNLSPYSNEIAAMPVDMTAPAAPQNLAAVAGDGQISIHWNPITGGDFDKYYIYSGLTPNPTNLIDSTTAAAIDDTLRTYTGLTNYTEYYFRVAAKDTSGNNSTTSNEISAVPIDQTAPDPPSSPLATAGDGSVDLSWTAVVESDFAKYYVYAGTIPNPSSRIDSIFSVNATMQTYSGLTNYTTYYYRITAVDTSGNESSRSTEVSATPYDMTSPSAPQNLSALAGDGQATIHWSPTGDLDFHRYYVYMDVTPNPISLFDSSSAPNDTLKIFEGLANNQTYYFRVASIDVNGNLSTYSNEIAVTPYDQTVPDAPLNLMAAVGNGQLQLHWNFTGDADLKRYRIYAGPAPNPMTIADSTDAGDRYDTLNVLKGLANGTEYFVRITSVDSTGNESTFSNEISGTPLMFTELSELNPDSSTVLLLHMNESSGSMVKDASGYGNDGTAYSGSLATAQGKFGYGREYDGTAQAKVEIPASPSITFGSGDFTAEMFVKTTSTAASQRLFFRYTGHSTKLWTVNLGFGADAGKLNFDGLGAPSINGTRALNDGIWHHIAAVRSDDSVFIYADGRLEGSGPVVEPDTAGGSLFVGGDGFNPDGTFDEVRLSNIARNPASFNLQLAPKNLAAIAAGTTINLSWNNGGGAAPLRRYYIYRGADSTTMSLLDSIAATNYADAGLASSTEYYYRITAMDSTGFEGARSYAAEATTGDLAPPANPQGLIASAGDGFVQLHWNPNTENDLAKYYIYAGTSIYPTTVIDSADGGLNDTLKIISGLANYQQYYFRISAIDTFGNISGYSDQSGAIPTDTTKPSVPQNFSAVAGDQQITIRWSPVPNSDFAKYYIYLSLLGNSSVVYDSLTAVDDTVKVLSGLNNYTGYYVRITAVDTNGNISDYSTELSSMPSDMTAPSAPVSLTVVDSMASYYTIVWNMNTENDIAKYYIYRDTVPNVTTLIDSTVNAVDTVRAFTTLTIGQPYYFRVAAVDTSFNISPLSNTASAVPFMIYGISSYVYGGGTVSPSGTTYVDHGDSLQFTIHADPLHHIDSIAIDAPIVLLDAITAADTRRKKVSMDAQQKILSSDPITIFGTGHDDTLRTYTFQNVTAGHTIRAYFAKNSFLIDAQVFGNGSITPDGSVPVYQGDTALFTITPDLYHHLDSVIVDGIKVDSICTYTFENVTAAHTIAAYFSPNELHHFVITNSDYMPIGSQTAGQTFTIITTAVDSLGNPVNTFTGNVWFSSTDTTIAVLGGDYSIPFTAGQHGPQIVTLYRGGMNTITVIDSVSGKSGTSASFLVNGAGLHHFSVKDTSGSGIHDQVENHPFPVMITAEDMFNNIQTDFTGTVEVTVSGAVLTQGEGVTSSFAGGILTPHIMQIENSALYVISVSDPISEKSGSSGLFTVVPDTNIIFTASINGTITPLGAHPVSYGDTVTVTFAPFAGHHFDSLYVDGVRVMDSLTQYTFFDVTATHSIDVYNSVDLNIPPVFTSVLSDTAIARFDSLFFDYQALDPDLGSLRYALDSAPAGAVIDSVTGELKYVPAADANGQYTLIVKVYDDSLATAYDTVNVRVNIYGDVSGNGTVSAFDGAMVLQNVVSAIAFTPLQEKVGDVSGSGTISSLDASYILQRAVGLISTFPGGLGKTTKVDAVLSAFSFRIQKSSKPEEYDLFVSVNKASNVYGIAMSLGFDSSIVTPLIMSKTASTDSMTMAFRFPDGSANLALAGITPLTSAGDIIKFTFRLKDPNYPKNAVLFTMKKFILNETDHTNDIGGITLNVRELAHLPSVYKLEQNFPNPFNPSTTINYQLPEAGSVRIVIYNMLGQIVRTLVNEEQSAGFYSMVWNGQDESHRAVASGVYLYRIEALGPNNKRFTEVKKMLLVK